MAGSPTITIWRQVLDVELRGTESDGMALQRRLPDVCTDVLAPVLESALGGADPGDAHIYVERLAIELDEVSLEGLERHLADAVRRELTDWLRRNVSGRGAGATADGNVRRRPVAEAVDDVLAVFLRTGRLPWTFRVPTGARLEDLVLDGWRAADHPGVTRGTPEVATLRLREALTDAHARTRLSMQFSPEFVTELLRHLAPESALTAERCLLALLGSDVPAPARTAFARRLWEQGLVAAASGHRLGAAELVAAAWRSLETADRLDGLATALNRNWPGATAPDRHAGGAASASSRTGQAVQHLPDDPQPDLGEDGALAVDNAGLVLLHPFLRQFLTGLGVADDDVLTDPNRAISLLHHLATGEMTAPNTGSPSRRRSARCPTQIRCRPTRRLPRPSSTRPSLC